MVLSGTQKRGLACHLHSSPSAHPWLPPRQPQGHTQPHVTKPKGRSSVHISSHLSEPPSLLEQRKALPAASVASCSPGFPSVGAASTPGDSPAPSRVIHTHSRLQCYTKVKVAQSGPTLCYPMDYTVHGILQARILEWVAFPFLRGSSQPRDQIQVSHILHQLRYHEPQEYWRG